MLVFFRGQESNIPRRAAIGTPLHGSDPRGEVPVPEEERNL